MYVWLLVLLHAVLIQLAFQDNIGCGSSEGCRPADAGSVTNTQAHAFHQLCILLLPLQFLYLHVWVTNLCRGRADILILDVSEDEMYDTFTAWSLRFTVSVIVGI